MSTLRDEVEALNGEDYLRSADREGIVKAVLALIDAHEQKAEPCKIVEGDHSISGEKWCGTHTQWHEKCHKPSDERPARDMVQIKTDNWGIVDLDEFINEQCRNGHRCVYRCGGIAVALARALKSALNTVVYFGMSDKSLLLQAGAEIAMERARQNANVIESIDANTAAIKEAKHG